MCGFAGFVGQVENRNQLTDMTNTIVHSWTLTVRGDMWMKMQRWDFGV